MNEYILKGNLCFKIYTHKHKASTSCPTPSYTYQIHPPSYIFKLFTIQIILLVIEALVP